MPVSVSKPQNSIKKSEMRTSFHTSVYVELLVALVSREKTAFETNRPLIFHSRLFTLIMRNHPQNHLLIQVIKGSSLRAGNADVRRT